MSLDAILNLLISNNLTADELLLVYLTFLATDEENNEKYFRKWYENGGSLKLKSLFNSLKEKGIILKNYNPESYIPNEIEFNNHFIKRWLKNSGELGQELFEAYPPFMYLNGKYVPIKNISKKWNSLDEFYFFYGMQIGHNPDKHKEVMDILKWAIDNDKISFGICSFVIDHQWETLKKLKDDPSINLIASTSLLDE